MSKHGVVSAGVFWARSWLPSRPLTTRVKKTEEDPQLHITMSVVYRAQDHDGMLVADIDRISSVYRVMQHRIETLAQLIVILQFSDAAREY